MYNYIEHYDALMNLCKQEDSSFYFVDQILDGVVYRIFSYRIASYTDFLQPYARDCRGVMFEMDGEDVKRLASLPLKKFFNLNENPFTMDLSFENVELIMNKEDGSLVSSYSHNGKILLKSKTSLSSVQAKKANSLLDSVSYSSLKNFITVMEGNDWTVNMEYTAPDNRIVIPHQHAALTVLNLRNRNDGEEMSYSTLKTLMQQYGCDEKIVTNIVDDVEDYEEFIKSISLMKDIEGYVIKIRDGETVKVKCNWYSDLHRMKDSVNSPKALYTVVVNEHHDDLRARFSDDEYIVNAILEMENRVKEIYKEFHHYVNGFYDKNKHLDRKSYAILANKELPKLYFGPAMSMYLGKEIDYKEFLIKKYKEYGIVETVDEGEE